MTFNPVPKPKRIEDKDLLAEVRKQRCAACSKFPSEKNPSDPNHVTTRGARGGDTKENCMPLCRPCHIQWHALGVSGMCNKYPTVRNWLWRMGRFDILKRIEKSSYHKRYDNIGQGA